MIAVARGNKQGTMRDQAGNAMSGNAISKRAARGPQQSLKLRASCAHVLCGPGQERKTLSSDAFYAQSRKLVREISDGTSGNKGGRLRWRIASPTFLGSSGFFFMTQKSQIIVQKLDS